jgi:hypothetical protein
MLVGTLVWACATLEIGPVLFIVTPNHGIHLGDLGME